MTQRRRILGVALGLLVMFLLLSTRRSTGSHPRDLRGLRDVEGSTAEDDSRARINEPPGKWDPLGDRFVNQHGGAVGNNNFQEQIEDISMENDNVPEDESIRRKTPKKKPLEDVNPDRAMSDMTKAGDAQESIGAEGNEESEKGSSVKEYDAADGIPLQFRFLIAKYETIVSFSLKRPLLYDLKHS